jgi:3-hydroxyisobutyrate dehydrogenase-like beta-hydroxyacid dehydrogenase
LPFVAGADKSNDPRLPFRESQNSSQSIHPNLPKPKFPILTPAAFQFPIFKPAPETAMKIGLLGLGNMGTPIALRLLSAGHELSVWNRTEERTKPAIHEGAIAAATPAEAELGADAVVTVLLDDAAYEEVFFGVHRLIDVLSPGLLHIICGTIGVALCKRLAAEHSKRGIDLVAAPVFGRPNDAAEGRLAIVAAGADKAVARARPLLEALAQRITVVGKDPQQAFAMLPGRAFPPAP